MGTFFSETLVRLRKEAGFPTAYRFYHDNGGAAGLKISYRKYLLIEQGKNLPVVERVPNLLGALRLPDNTPGGRELTLAWLRTLAGEEIYGDLFRPLLTDQPVAELTAPEQTLRRAMGERKFHLTEAQVMATLSSFETYKCNLVMSNDGGAWSAEELAGLLGIDKALAKGALEEFAEVGLAKRVKKGSYRSRTAGKMVVYPLTSQLRAGVREKLREYLKKLERKGSGHYSSSILLRADSAALRAYFPMLKATVEAALAYSTTKKTRESAVFCVIGRVLKLWDF